VEKRAAEGKIMEDVRTDLQEKAKNKGKGRGTESGEVHDGKIVIFSSSKSSQRSRFAEEKGGKGTGKDLT